MASSAPLVGVILLCFVPEIPIHQGYSWTCRRFSRCRFRQTGKAFLPDLRIYIGRSFNGCNCTVFKSDYRHAHIFCFQIRVKLSANHPVNQSLPLLPSSNAEGQFRGYTGSLDSLHPAPMSRATAPGHNRLDAVPSDMDTAMAQPAKAAGFQCLSCFLYRHIKSSFWWHAETITPFSALLRIISSASSIFMAIGFQ